MSSSDHWRYGYIQRDEELSKNWFHKLPVLTKRGSSSVSTSLCFGCDSLDLPGILARMRADPDLKNVALPPWKNSAWFSMNDGACALCAMFSANWDVQGTIEIRWMESKYFDVPGILSSWSPAALVFYSLKSTKNATFEIIPTQDNHLDPMPCLLDLSFIDFDRMRLWLQSCYNVDLSPKPRQKPDYLPGFRLIHCRSREIIRPPRECRYVALSYVWGKNLPEESQSQRFPRTIEDAIKVCLKLGFEYIWIDRYCIDQSNYEDKHAQISQMDVIYSDASLVIIAAAGNDPTYGLPGVGSQARTPQQSIKLRNCTLLQTFPEVHHELKVSAWIKRGWTLQEGYFGTRKLIFTDNQVIYICKHGHCNESIFPRTIWDTALFEWRLADEHECGRQRARSWLDSHFLFEDGQSQKTTVLPGIKKCGIINEFTRRSLSYDSDVYHAIHGVLSAWSKAEPSNEVGHICDIPVGKDGPELCWEGHDSTLIPRREGFPTWSWLSRKGLIPFPYKTPLAFISVQTHNDIDFEATSKLEAVPSDDLWVSITACSNRSDLRTQFPGVKDDPHSIRISGWCPRVRMGRRSVDRSQYVEPSECTIKKSDGHLRFASRKGSISLDRHDLTHTEWKSCVTVLIGSTGDSRGYPLSLRNNFYRLGFLILCSTFEKDVYERVGICHVWLEHTSSRDSFVFSSDFPDWDTRVFIVR